MGGVVLRATGVVFRAANMVIIERHQNRRKSINDKKGCLDILLKYHSYNKENVNNYKNLADELLLKDKPSIYDLNNIFSEQPKEIDFVDEFVIVIPINKLHNPKVLYKNLSKLNENQIKQKVSKNQN